MNRKKIITLVALLTGVLFAAAWLYSWFFTATIVVTAPQADIRIIQGDVEISAKDQATFKTMSTERVFVEAKKSGAATQKYIQPKRHQTIKITLDVKDIIEAQRVGTGPLSRSLVKDGFIYGINPFNGYLGVEPLANNNTNQLPRVPFLPSLDQVIWKDSKNFLYITATEGAGVVSTQPEVSVDGLIYTEAASSGNTTALLGSDGLFLTKGIDAKKAKKIDSAKKNVQSFLFADSRFAFYGWLNFEETHEGEIEAFESVEEVEEHDPGIENSTLKVFDHTGKRLQELTIPSNDVVYRVLSADSSRLITLAGDGLYVIDMESGETERKTFSFGRVQDMVELDGQLLLLGPAGLWEYNLDKDEYYKVASYPIGGEYVPTSLTLQGKDLYFSTSIAEGGFDKNKDIQNSIFKITLD